MTNAEFSGQHVDTDPFRKAIWNYSENIYGYVYSNYDYGKVFLKSHIKYINSKDKQMCSKVL